MFEDFHVLIQFYFSNFVELHIKYQQIDSVITFKHNLFIIQTGMKIALSKCESGGSMKFSIHKYIRVFLITSLTTTSLVLFQNCSNYSAHLSAESVDELQKGNGVDGGETHIASADVISEGDDSVPIQIDPVDSHSDMSPTAPVAGDPTGTETNPDSEIIPPVVENPPVDTPPVVVNPPVEMPPVVSNPPVVENPPVEMPPVVSNPPVVTPPTSPIIEEKPACFVSGNLENAEDSYGSTIMTSDGGIVVSSDLRPVISSDGKHVVYGNGSSHSTETTTTSTTPRTNCSYYAQGRNQKDILVLTQSNNNVSIQADSCGVKMIVYDGVEPLRLKTVTANDIHICGNIKIEELEARGGAELTNVQVEFARIKGNLTTFKIDSGFRVPVSERKAGKKAKNSYVNSNFEIIPL